MNLPLPLGLGVSSVLSPDGPSLLMLLLSHSSDRVQMSGIVCLNPLMGRAGSHIS